MARLSYLKRITQPHSSALAALHPPALLFQERSRFSTTPPAFHEAPIDHAGRKPETPQEIPRGPEAASTEGMPLVTISAEQPAPPATFPERAIQEKLALDPVALSERGKTAASETKRPAPQAAHAQEEFSPAAVALAPVQAAPKRAVSAGPDLPAAASEIAHPPPAAPLRTRAAQRVDALKVIANPARAPRRQTTREIPQPAESARGARSSPMPLTPTVESPAHPAPANSRRKVQAPPLDSVQIGTIEVRVVQPPPQPRMASRPRAEPVAALSRGYTSSVGLRQG